MTFKPAECRYLRWCTGCYLVNFGSCILGYFRNVFFQGGLPTFLEIIQTLITFEQPTFALVYFAVGGFFAAFVYAVSVVAIPLMADRGTDAVTAAIASLLSVTRNVIPMSLWALTIVLLVAIGFATHFIGLIITMPIIGHASWHAYRDLVAEV